MQLPIVKHLLLCRHQPVYIGGPTINHTLEFWERGIEIYTQKCFASIAFDKFTNSQSRMDKIIHGLTNSKATMLLIGGAGFSPNSPIKGHVRCPGVRKFTTAVKKYPQCDVLFVDEFNTSQYCGICVKRFPRHMKSSQYEKCTDCIEEIVPKAPCIIARKPKRLYQRERNESQSHVSKSINQCKFILKYFFPIFCLQV